MPSSLVTPKQRSTFQQTCQAEGFPPPVVKWTRLGMPLPAGKTEVNQGNLTIRNLDPVDSGLYECVATNVMGTKKAKMNLVVQRVTLGLYLPRENNPVREGSGGGSTFQELWTLVSLVTMMCKENQNILREYLKYILPKKKAGILYCSRNLTLPWQTLRKEH